MDKALALGVVLSLWLAASASHAHDDSARGQLVTVTPVAALDQAAVTAYLAERELPTEHVAHGLDAYRFVYRTVDVDGKPTTASSLVVVARGAPQPLRAAAWLHGTTVYRGDVASLDDSSEDRAVAYFLAAAGFSVTAPDYLGLGRGPGVHPYDHAPSEVSASLDALRATRRFLAGKRVPASRELAISGFSQGGRAAMALARSLKQQPEPEWTASALSPIAGPYDMSGTLELAVDGGIEHVTAYLAYLTVAWNRVYHLYEAPEQAFRQPYAATIEGLFDNSHTTEQVFARLPDTLEALFTPMFLHELEVPRGNLRAALLAADGACDFQPPVAVQLYSSHGDNDVPIDNARYCAQELELHAAEGNVIDLGRADHGATLGLALPHVLRDFTAR